MKLAIFASLNYRLGDPVDPMLQIEAAALPDVALHPTIVDDYRRQVRERVIQDAGSDIRELIDRIVLAPKPQGRVVVVEVIGRFIAIVALALGTPVAASSTVAMERVKGIEPSS